MSTGATNDALSHNRAFVLFWCGQSVSSIGDGFTFVALPLLVLKATGSTFEMGLVSASFAAGSMLSAVVVGHVVDRFSRRAALISADIVRALLLLAIPTSTWAGWFSLPLLAVIAFGVGAAANASGVAFVSFLPEIVPRAKLLSANAWLQGSVAVCFAVGPALAGPAVGRWGPELAIALDSLTFIAPIVTLACIRSRWPPPRTKGKVDGLSAGRFIMRTPALRTIVVVLALEALGTEAIRDLFAFRLERDLGQTDAAVGLTFGAASVGGIVGAVTASRARRRIGFRGTFVANGALMASALAIASFTRSSALTILLGVVVMYGIMSRAILSISYRQEVTPHDMLGRVTALFWLACRGMGFGGAVLLGFVGERFGVPVAFRVASGLFALLTIATAAATSLSSAASAGRSVERGADDAQRRDNTPTRGSRS